MKNRICVVTPCFNAERFIDEAINSIASQGVELHYHVQDGGSTDGTVAKLEDWSRRLDGQVRFSWDSAADGGMYDAINRGFARLDPGDDDTLCWLNADDLLCTGALRFAAKRFAEFPQVDFLVSRHFRTAEDGAIDKMFRMNYFPRATLAAGLHDGRHLNFVPQEGSFWRGRLWNKVGGVNARLRLAGDFDLWRRFARHADCVTVDLALCQRRVHEDQLSQDMEAYYREVDSLFSPEERARSDRLYQDEFLPWIESHDSKERGKFCGPELYCGIWPGKTPEWTLVHRPYGSTRLEDVPFQVSARGTYLPRHTKLADRVGRLIGLRRAL